MYFNANEIAYYGPGPDIGLATAKEPSGPWMKSEMPVLNVGSKGEWDAGYIFPTSVVMNADGNLMIYYTACSEKFPSGLSNIGVAFSKDGIHWKKHNDSATTRHPYSESDPILKTEKGLAWEKDGLWSCHVLRTEKGFEMYYGGERIDKLENDNIEFGYAFSNDGIHWVRHEANPVFSIRKRSDGRNFCEFPSVCLADSMAFLYYDNGSIDGEIGVATAEIKSQ